MLSIQDVECSAPAEGILQLIATGSAHPVIVTYRAYLRLPMKSLLTRPGDLESDLVDPVSYV